MANTCRKATPGMQGWSADVHPERWRHRVAPRARRDSPGAAYSQEWVNLSSKAARDLGSPLA